MTHHILNVVVLMGGPSGEHEISLKSGSGVAEALSQRHWTVTPIVIPKTLTVAQAISWTRQALERACPDVVFVALHGTFGEDGVIQQLCEETQLAYTGSDSVASRLGMDKAASRRRFEQAGLRVPQWTVVDVHADGQALPKGFSLPVVIKPMSQGSSLGVSIVRSPSGLAGAFEQAAEYGSQVLVEAFVEGREVTVGVLGDDTLPVIEIRPHHAFFDFTAKYTPGSTDYLVPAPLETAVVKKVQAAGRAAHEVLGCRHLSRTDCIVNRDGEPVILEVNTIPGFTPTSLLPKAAACIGLSYQDVCERLVLLALQRAPETQPVRAEVPRSLDSRHPAKAGWAHSGFRPTGEGKDTTGSARGAP